MTDIEKLADLVARAMEDIEHCDLDPGGISTEYEPLANALTKCFRQIKEVYQFTAAIADGNFQAPIPDRHNYLVGPSKDLYYKLKHLTWQAEEVAKGDYSQRVDFLGSFSDSFNFMITELERREKHEAELSEEKLRAVQKQNDMLQKQMERQMFHYRAYRDFINSFLNFRGNYKKMMGEVFTLFQAGKYEEGRLLVAKINDRMATEVMAGKNYSNNDFVNAAMGDIADVCQNRDVQFDGQVHIPEKYCIGDKWSSERVFNVSELLISLLEIGDHTGQSLTVSGGAKNGWFTLHIVYRADSGDFPSDPQKFLPPESLEIIDRLKADMDEHSSFFNLECLPEQHQIEIAMHISGES